jgi:hypothetical protein
MSSRTVGTRSTGTSSQCALSTRMLLRPPSPPCRRFESRSARARAARGPHPNRRDIGIASWLFLRRRRKARKALPCKSNAVTTKTSRVPDPARRQLANTDHCAPDQVPLELPRVPADPRVAGATHLLLRLRRRCGERCGVGRSRDRYRNGYARGSRVLRRRVLQTKHVRRPNDK